jgi:hypothetical protein
MSSVTASDTNISSVSSFSKSCLQLPITVSLPYTNARPAAAASTDDPETYSEFQYSVHKPPNLMRRELKCIFADCDFDSTEFKENLLIIPTFQRVKTSDLTEFTAESEIEKNRLLEVFYSFAKLVCNILKGEHNYWSEAIDPPSGLPLISANHTSSIYSEVDAAQMLLRYRIQQAGSCSIILHPSWGSRSYPATLFTIAPLHIVNKVIQRVTAELQQKSHDHSHCNDNFCRAAQMLKKIKAQQQ